MLLCSKLQKYNPATFNKLIISEMEPTLSEELKSFQLKKKKGDMKTKNTETVLIVMQNEILAIKNSSKMVEESQEIEDS